MVSGMYDVRPLYIMSAIRLYYVRYILYPLYMVSAIYDVRCTLSAFFSAGPNAALFLPPALIKAGVKYTDNNRSTFLSIVLFTEWR